LGDHVSTVFAAGIGAQSVEHGRARITVADFVQTVFIPECVEKKAGAGKTHFRSILKHIVTPERVEAAFSPAPMRPKAKWKTVDRWPYMDNLKLSEVEAAHVQHLMTQARDHGYSPQTVAHIRNVVRAIFELAMEKQYLVLANPARRIPVPQFSPGKGGVLSPSQTRELLRMMSYPEREMTLLVLLTDMNIPEICGLQWKMANIGDTWHDADGELIAARTLAIREQWCGGDLNSVRPTRRREVPMPNVLLHALVRLKNSSQFTAPEDFVFAAETGKPVNARVIATRKLRDLGKRLNIEGLSWQMLHRAHSSLMFELGPHSLAALCGETDAASKKGT
jgi:site-specific recombinase XerC